jgi:hypothetical protein
VYKRRELTSIIFSLPTPLFTFQTRPGPVPFSRLLLPYTLSFKVAGCSLLGISLTSITLYDLRYTSLVYRRLEI